MFKQILLEWVSFSSDVCSTFFLLLPINTKQTQKKQIKQKLSEAFFFKLITNVSLAIWWGHDRTLTTHQRE